MKRLLLLLSFAAFLAGCGTPGHVHEGDPARVSVGMTREQVIKKIGQPETFTKEGEAEVLSYTLERPWWQTSQYRVKIVNGSVQSSEIVSPK
jgi:hypothetical protein